MKLPTWTFALIWGVCTATTHAGDRPEWISELGSESAEHRDAALAALPKRLLDRRSLAELLAAATKDPEIESRGRAACEASPALAPVLASLARPPENHELARSWLEAALAAEIARRAPLDRLVARFGRSTLFTAPVLTGTRIPRLDDSRCEIEFDHALAWLADRGEFERPVVLDPSLEIGGIQSVRGAECLASTAGGLLKRWLVPRALKTVDLGLVQLVTTPEIEEAIAMSRERDVDANRRRRIEFDSARLLAHRLTRELPGGAIARWRIWRALGIAGAPGGARRLPAMTDEALRALATLAPDATGAEVVAFLESTTPDFGEEVVRTLAAGGVRGADWSQAFAASESPVVARACSTLLSARRIVGADRMAGDLLSKDAGIAVDLTIAALEGRLAFDPTIEVQTDSEDRCPALFLALDRLTLQDARVSAYPAVFEMLRRSTRIGPLVDSFEAGRSFRTGEARIPRLDSELSRVRAFLLGAAFSDTGEPSRDRARAIVAIAAREVVRLPELSRVAAVFATPRAELIASAASLARLDELSLRAAVSRAALLHSHGDDALANALWQALRGRSSTSRTHAALHDELGAILSVDELGSWRFFDPFDFRSAAN